MAKRRDRDGATAPGLLDGIDQGLDGGELWVGEHTVDRDILVLDPESVDLTAERLSFYSLAQHRMRTFPRETAARMIQPLTDEVGGARAREAYARRTELQQAHHDALAADRVKRDESQRQGVLEAHRRHLDALGVAYEGVRETSSGRRVGRRTRCHVCGIALDDFVAAACSVCDGVLCSCGACACGGVARSRSAR